MKKVTFLNKLTLFCILFIAASFGVKAQELLPVPVNYPFSSDSLKGFDEISAKQAAFNAACYGDEFKVYMYVAKRHFIDGKYNLNPAPIPVKNIPYNSGSNAKGNPGNPSILVANCQNEDFESATGTSANIITTTNGVTGWTITGGSNSSWGATGNCTNTTAITGNPNAVQVVYNAAAGGTVDPTIGAAYPLYSVFGNTTVTYPAATSIQSPTFQCYGNWFLKLNNSTAGSSVNQASKEINVTPANALFQFAFITVLQTGHCCCDNGSFRLKVYTYSGCTSGVATQTSCPSFSAASNAGTGCTPSGTCVSGGNTTTYLPAAAFGVAYNKWKLNTLDLTPFINCKVKIEVTAIDCPYSGHFGYVYFDAQCSPMDIIGNTGTYPAGTPSITLPTCGAGSTATITAPPVTGGYTWTAPGGGTVTGVQTITTTITGNHTLTMNPPGSCSPIIRVINVIIAPAPNLVVPTQTMYTCSNATLNGVSLIMASGTATNNPSIPNYTVSFSPAQPTATAGVSANTGTYTGLSVGVNTITITDSVGCIATQTILVTPQPIVPTFSIDAPMGTVVGCAPPFLPLNAINTNTATTGMTYTWTSATQPASVTSSYNGYGTTTYTIFGQGFSVSNPTLATCVSQVTFAISSSTAVPSMTVSPISASITCNGGCKTFTAVTTTTTNINGTWYDPFGVAMVTSGTPMLMCANAPGTYTATYCNVINGCCTSQTVAVTSNTAIPTISVTSVFGFVLNCTRPCLPMNINSSGTLAPTTYTWTNLTTSVSTFPANGGFTVCITGANGPGSYEAAFMDGNFCKVTTTINVTIDTLRPSPLSMTNLPSNSYTLTCATPSLVATALTNPLYAPTSYSWTQPPNFIINSNTINIGTGNVTSSTSPTTYTVSAIGPNGCVGRAKVDFYKNIYVPPYGVAFTPTAITCANPCVALTATTTTTVNVTYTFTSPPPTATATTAGALMCTGGTYTMNYQNVNNGCPGVAYTTVPLNVTPPATFALTPKIIGCGSTSVGINAGHTGSAAAVGTYSYTWDPPFGAGMSCPGGVNCYSSSVNQAGIYGVFILNTINGCSATNSVEVFDMGGNIAASINADPSTGFSPMSVNFANTTTISPTGTITTTWNYGNGISMSYSGTAQSYSATGPPAGSTVYQSAGNYTVYMVITQFTGTLSCTGTASTVIKVELPSKIEIPNVFTPNGDGVNDNFTLLTTNLTEITCKIFDRWGVKMYDVTAEKGNISWDGQNLGKKDVPSGTYFYILKAKGKDAKDYEQTGTISLYR